MDLSRFLATEYDPRPHLQEPMRWNDSMVATNGHILIILPHDEGIEHAVSAPEKVAKSIADFCAMERTTDPIPLANIDLGKADLCPSCRGAGSAYRRGCPTCCGDGDIERNSEWIECPDCGGNGDQACSKDDESAKLWTCWHCEGFGQDYQPLLINDTHLQRKYLALIAALPNSHIQTAGQIAPARFTFDGGYGFLMPCYPTDDIRTPLGALAPRAEGAPSH